MSYLYTHCTTAGVGHLRRLTPAVQHGYTDIWLQLFKDDMFPSLCFDVDEWGTYDGGPPAESGYLGEEGVPVPHQVVRAELTGGQR
jgi:hypothetical protein